jgi:hypothetical protein
MHSWTFGLTQSPKFSTLIKLKFLKIKLKSFLLKTISIQNHFRKKNFWPIYLNNFLNFRWPLVYYQVNLTHLTITFSTMDIFTLSLDFFYCILNKLFKKYTYLGCLRRLKSPELLKGQKFYLLMQLEEVIFKN